MPPIFAEDATKPTTNGRTSRRAFIAAAVFGLLMLPTVPSAAVIPPPAPEPLPSVVVLARADNPVDALSASAVAGRLGAHVQITSTDRLDDPAREALQALQPDLVIIAGGIAAISEGVEQAVRDLGFTTARYAGADRVATSRELARVADDLAFGRPLLTGAQVTGDGYLGGVLALESLSVESQTLVENLNADLLDGFHAADFLRSADLKGFVTQEEAENFLTEEDAEGFVTDEEAEDFLTDEEAAGFVQAEGEFRISTNDWRVPDEDPDSNGPYLQPGTGLVTRLLTETAGNAQAVAYPELPVSLFGETLQLVGMELCYGNSGSTLQQFSLLSWIFDEENPESQGTSAIATQNTPEEPTGAACERLDLEEPYTLTSDDRVAAVVQAELPNADASNLELYRLTFILQDAG